MSPKITPYIRNTVQALGELNEETELPSVENDLQIAMYDAALAHLLNADLIKMLNAFELADITTMQAAKVIYLMGVLADKGSK